MTIDPRGSRDLDQAVHIEPGSAVTLRLDAADAATRTVSFSVV